MKKMVMLALGAAAFLMTGAVALAQEPEQAAEPMEATGPAEEAPEPGICNCPIYTVMVGNKVPCDVKVGTSNRTQVFKCNLYGKKSETGDEAKMPQCNSGDKKLLTTVIVKSQPDAHVEITGGSEVMSSNPVGVWIINTCLKSD